MKNRFILNPTDNFFYNLLNHAFLFTLYLVQMFAFLCSRTEGNKVWFKTTHMNQINLLKGWFDHLIDLIKLFQHWLNPYYILLKFYSIVEPFKKMFLKVSNADSVIGICQFNHLTYSVLTLVTYFNSKIIVINWCW
jgi:hypothetical protein